MEELTKEEGAQDQFEEQEMKRQQHPFPHTRKTAIGMVAERMVSNNPKLHKVSLISKPEFMQWLAKLVEMYPW